MNASASSAPKSSRDFPTFLAHSFTNLEKKGFLFLFDSDLLKSGVDEQRQKVNDFINAATPWLAKFVSLVYQNDGIPRDLTENLFSLVKIGIEEGETKDVKMLYEQMKAEFQLNAIKVSSAGVSYIAFLDCDGLSSEEIVEKAKNFEQFAVGLQFVIGRSQGRILDIPFHKAVDLPVYGSLCLTFTEPYYYKKLAKTVDSMELKAVPTPMNMLRLIGMPFISKGPVWLNKITYSLFDNRIRKSRKFSSPLHYRYSLSDLIIR